MSMKFHLFTVLIKSKILKDNEFSCQKHSDIVFILLINVKMPTIVIVGILTFMGRITFMLGCIKHVIKFYNLVGRGWGCLQNGANSCF